MSISRLKSEVTEDVGLHLTLSFRPHYLFYLRSCLSSYFFCPQLFTFNVLKMKYNAAVAVLASAIAIANAAPTPTPERRLFGSDSANDMVDVINGELEADCKDVAVIFARGTFDSGNIGVWVGPQFRSALEDSIESLAFQGVDSTAYPATLGGYLSNGGPASGAQSLADTVTQYASECPQATIVVSGWSQGAGVAHQAISLMSSAVQQKVAALVTFGDPNKLFRPNDKLPSNIQFHTECLTGTTLDPLCADIPADFKFPTSLSDITRPFTALPGLVKGAEEAAAAVSLVARFPIQLAQSVGDFASTVTNKNKLQRLLLSPQHFTYGNLGLTTTAAEFVAGLPQVAGK
ncbi:carbohydrate esterase family 5 protein [Favolaschia claudopus]|uniref:cutinase n=1 Tax=Favolaschia claudopus TaxID=2862362 RepID=A0AAW0DVW0_9AGAR